jgi:hypothetical protein
LLGLLLELENRELPGFIQVKNLAWTPAGRQTKFFGRSAGWHPAVSRISNPQTFGQPGGVENPAPSRLEIGDTADWEICATKNFVLHPLQHLAGKLLALPNQSG